MKKRVHTNDQKNLPWDFKKCTGSLYFPLLLIHFRIYKQPLWHHFEHKTNYSFPFIMYDWLILLGEIMYRQVKEVQLQGTPAGGTKKMNHKISLSGNTPTWLAECKLWHLHSKMTDSACSFRVKYRASKEVLKIQEYSTDWLIAFFP